MIKYGEYNLFIDGARRGRVTLDANDPTVRTYEERVRVLLNGITRLKVGQALFKSFYARYPIRIVPYLGEDCNARTGQISSDPNKGVGVQFSPETWAFDACGKYPGYRPWETIFHELVHASRFSNFGYGGLNKDPLDKMQDYEEFLAVMLTNVYRSEEGATKFNKDYLTGKLVSQAELEQFLASSEAYIGALRDFLSDPLVKLMVSVTTPFNPFRDFQRLQGIYQARFLNGLPKL